ncbi:MAG: hypothetical protein HUU57_16905, partial [Bdellovibrio sp.]|nr:hypothetical protein [Bdellovibrio sp.]
MKNISRRTQVLIALVGCSLVTAVFFTNCAKSGFEAARGNATGLDPFLEYAWHINNSGQKVFSTDAGLSGVDLNLKKTWTEGITGKG